MSTLRNVGKWSITDRPLESRYEKCRNITEEIYKRINITFQIKKLEATQSDISDYNGTIGSDELSNETDLFACDKTDSISSSTEAEKPQATCEKYININNNEETQKKAVIAYKRPRKRFRKRIKKRQSKSNRSETDGSSDEAPLSRIVDLDTKCVKANEVESPHNVMGVPNIIIVANLKPKLYTPQKKPAKNYSAEKNVIKKEDTTALKEVAVDFNVIENDRATDLSVNIDKCTNMEWKHCDQCSLSFRGDRGLRRHVAMSHITAPDISGKSNN